MIIYQSPSSSDDSSPEQSKSASVDRMSFKFLCDQPPSSSSPEPSIASSPIPPHSCLVSVQPVQPTYHKLDRITKVEPPYSKVLQNQQKANDKPESTSSILARSGVAQWTTAPATYEDSYYRFEGLPSRSGDPSGTAFRGILKTSRFKKERQPLPKMRNWTRMTPELFNKIVDWENEQRKSGTIKQSEIERKWNVNRTTYYRWKLKMHMNKTNGLVHD